jgi:OPA family glycerol-3-phosphate transporter-like MFS transporter
MLVPSASPPGKEPKTFRFWQSATMAGLFIGYSGYYICRSNLAVATPLIIHEFGDQGINKEVMGQIASLGVVFYSIGKVINGVIGDFIGGRKVFLLGMAGSVLATVLFGLGTGLAVFFAAWAFNRAVQSMGWGGLVKVTAHWFSYRSYGKIMALLSLSFLFGDIIAKLLLGQLIAFGLHWRQLFFVAAGMLTVIGLIDLFLVKESPERIGFGAPPVNPDNLFTEAGTEERVKNLKELLLPYFRSLSFGLVLVMSFGLTAIREAFNFWVPTYLYEVAGLKESASSQLGSLFPVFGMVSILGAGYLSDTVAKGRRGVVILAACLPMTLVLFLMAGNYSGDWLPLLFISLVGLLLLGPYSFLAGAMSLDAGGRKGAATAAGLVDAVGYVGGTLSLWLTGLLAQRVGWSGAFLVLAGLAGITAAAAGLFYWTQERGTKQSETLSNQS